MKFPGENENFRKVPGKNMWVVSKKNTTKNKALDKMKEVRSRVGKAKIY